MLLDFSKTDLDAHALTLLIQLAEARGVPQRRDAMFRGEPINVTEDRAVLHTALRNRAGTPVLVDGADVMPEVDAVLDRMAAFADGRPQRRDRRRRAAASPTSSTSASAAPTSARRWRRWRSRPTHDGPRLHFVSNVDGAHVARHARAARPGARRW